MFSGDGRRHGRKDSGMRSTLGRWTVIFGLTALVVGCAHLDGRAVDDDAVYNAIQQDDVAELRRLVESRALTVNQSLSVPGYREGTPLITMAKTGFEVAGCDISQEMVAAARRNFKANGLSETLIQWGDVEDSTTLAGQLADGRFDAVIAAGVMPHVKNDRLFLDNVKMLLKPGE